MVKKKIRLPKMAVSGTELSVLPAGTPWMPMWWSAALPGLGHLCQGFYFKGLILMFWEVLINTKARLNLGIIYTFTGQFAKAREVVDPGWSLFYGVVFFFAIYDSYRIRMELNALSRLEQKQSRHNYRLMYMSGYSMTYLGRSNPWVAAAWSALLTGFGHIYNMKTFKALVLLIWTVAIIVLAHLTDAIVATFTGRFSRAAAIVDYQWLLFYPSVYIFAIWDAYNDSVEKNKLFAEAQKSYLRKKYYPKERKP